MQNGTYPWMASSSLTQKSWPPGYQASLTDLFLKKNPLHFGTGISQLAAASNYIEKMSTMNDSPPKCPHPDAKDKPYPCEICQQYLSLCNSLRTDGTSGTATRPNDSPVVTNSPTERKPMNLMPNAQPSNPVPTSSMHHSPTNSIHPPMNVLPPGQHIMHNNKPRPIPTKQYPCPVCHKLFTQKGNLKTHMMIHTGEKPYACHACGKSFTQKGNVDTHMKIHTGEREYGCESCGKRFTQKGNLKTHIRSVHTKEKPFACGMCGKCFSQKGNMQTHLRTHNKDDRFPCTLCGKTFSQKGNLKTHMARHAGQIPTKRQFGSRLANRTYMGQLAKTGQPMPNRLPPFPIQPSPISSQASSTSPLHSPTTPQPLSTPNHNQHPDIRSPPHGIGNPYSDSPIDLKPPINCHLPLSRPLSCHQPSVMNNSPSPHPSHLSSPPPEDEQNTRHFFHSKLFQHANNLHSPGYMNEPLPDMHSHHSLIPGVSQQSRITSPLPVGTPNHIPNHDRDSRPFYSAPPTPIPAPMTPVSRWLPHSTTRQYDSYQLPAGLGSYTSITPHTTPLSRLSLLASGSMNNHNHNNPHLENHSNSQLESHNNRQLENHNNTQLENHNPQLEHHTNSQLEHHTNSQLEHHTNSQLEHRNNSQLEHRNNSQLEHRNNSQLEHRNNSQLEHHNNSQLEHRNNSQLEHHSNSQLEHHNSSQLEHHNNSQLEHHNNPQLEHCNNPQLEHCNNPQLEHHNNPQLENHNNPQLENHNDPQLVENHNNPQLENGDDEIEQRKENNVVQHSQEHFHSPTNPDFSQLLD